MGVAWGTRGGEAQVAMFCNAVYIYCACAHVIYVRVEPRLGLRFKCDSNCKIGWIMMYVYFYGRGSELKTNLKRILAMYFDGLYFHGRAAADAIFSAALLWFCCGRLHYSDVLLRPPTQF